MEVTELRIGNLTDNNVEIHAITARDILFLSSGDNMHFCNPIDITEDWLIRLGFEKSNNNTRFYTFDKDKLSIHLKSEQYKNGRTYFNSWCIIDKQIESVHQLQNLYFALTNKELTL